MGVADMLKLSSLKNPRNLQFLSVLLDVVLKNDAVGPLVWDAFGKRFTSSSTAVEEAKSRLTEIKLMIDEYRGKK